MTHTMNDHSFSVSSAGHLSAQTFRFEGDNHMSATSFKANLQDIRFVLFDQLDIDSEYLKIEKFAGFDHDLYDATIEEARRVAEEVLEPVNKVGDREKVHFDGKGNITTPACFKDAWKVVSEGGWIGIWAPPEWGGTGLPHAMGVMVNELFSGAAMAFCMYMGLTGGAARVIGQFGPAGMREEYAQKMFSGEWGGTMCLTEAGAGSAVGDNRCKAHRTDEAGVYHLEGEKIFISGGDQDLTSNIIHLVLARTLDAPAGSKGLSLFIVPKFHVNADLSAGDRNDARVVSIEHKMGIHGSSTCVLALGTQGVCKGYLVGQEGQGMELMFHMMNEARIGVGIQGVSMAAAAHGCALSYARDRIQGTSIANMRDANAPRVAIIDHPDVRRNLMNQKVSVETMRSLVYRLALWFDMAEHTPDEALKKTLQGRVELLVPIVKSYCTDLGYKVTVDALQTFGGYGYTNEYPVEQFVRDAKITSIYEGTNGIQAMDLLGRKLRMKGGALFMEWMQYVQGELAKASAEGFGPQADAINKAMGQLGQTAMSLGALGMQGKLDQAMLHAQPFLDMMGNVCLAFEAVEQARVAKRKMATEGETAFLAQKLLNLDWYVAHHLPAATAIGKAIQSGGDAALDPRAFA
jgi:alkylation response protein AidB-like acyl-CoA dehydrogenase